jgi:hypothetical protein
MIKGSAAALVLVGSAAAATSLTNAQEAYDRNQVAQAAVLFERVAADPSAGADDRADAGVALARIAWLIDGNSAAALQRLAAARSTGGKSCSVAVMKARILREAGRSAEAISAEPQLLQACVEPPQRDVIRTHVIGARLDLASGRPSSRAGLLRDAQADERQLTTDAGVEGARVRLETALLTNDAAGALAAWKDYFWLEDSDAPQALEKLGVTGVFNRGLAAGAAADDRIALAGLLMRAGFADQSKRYAAARGLPGSDAANPVWRRLQAYWTERDKLQAELLRVNRALARGAAKDSLSLEAPAKAATIALMTAAGASGDPREALLKYYGLVGSVGTTSGYPSIHMGHVIEDHDDVVTQYGHSAKIHFQAIDNMIGNGFESWLWDGSAGVGGWTANGVIVHVRPRYVQAPLSAWRLTQDSPERRRLLERQAAFAAEDIAKLKQRPVATLEGLNDRLQLQLVDEIAATARSAATNQADVRRLFLAEYSKANLNQSIRVHEGRHAIDNTLGLDTTEKVDQAVLEYRAKLSELALTAYPRMALRNMNRNLEGDGPHDRGGAHVFDDYRKWMEAHRDQILGYDPTVPVLEQLDKLSDGQIRDIARGVDPLGTASNSTSTKDRHSLAQ